MKKTTLRPCDCKDYSDSKKLSENGIGYGLDNIILSPNLVVINMGHTTLRIPMKMFKRFAEWYLEPQEVEPYNVPDDDTNVD